MFFCLMKRRGKRKDEKEREKEKEKKSQGGDRNRWHDWLGGGVARSKERSGILHSEKSRREMAPLTEGHDVAF